MDDEDIHPVDREIRRKKINRSINLLAELQGLKKIINLVDDDAGEDSVKIPVIREERDTFCGPKKHRSSLTPPPQMPSMPRHQRCRSSPLSESTSPNPGQSVSQSVTRKNSRGGKGGILEEQKEWEY